MPMPIMFNCPCGKTLRVPDEHAGRRAKCPACNAIVNIPAPEPEPVFEIVETPPVAASPPPAPPKAVPVAKPKLKPQVVEEEEEGGTYGLEKEDDKNKARGKTGKSLPNFRRGTEHHKNS